MKSTIKVGDVLVFVGKYDKKPITVNVSHVTAKGWVRVTMPSGKESYSMQPEKYSPYLFESVGGCIYPLTDLDRLNVAHEKHCIAKEKEKAQNEKARFEREQIHQNELAEVKTKMTVPATPLATTADGRRVYFFIVPIKPDSRHGERPVTVACKEGREYSYVTGEEKIGVEARWSWTDASSSGSGDCRGVKDDEECLWEAARSVYNAW